MKWFKDLQKEYQVALIMLPILVVFYLLNCCSPIRSDDFAYQFICGANEWFGPNSVRIDSFSDIIQSQYNHYFEHTGRAIIHILEQGFVSIWGRPLFNVLNTLMFGLFTYLTIALIDRSLLRNYMAWGLVAICVALFLPAHVSFYFIVAHALNYLWSLTFCLLFVYIWTYYKFEKWSNTILLSILCFFLGWSQELFAMPIAGAICTYYLINRREIFTKRCLLSFAFCCGVLILVVAPGNFNRHGLDSSILSHIKLLVKSVISNVSILTLIIITATVIFRFGLKRIGDSIKDKPLYLTIFIISLLLSLKVPVTGDRVFMSIGYWLMILLSIVLISNLKDKNIYKPLFFVGYISILIATLFVSYYSYINGRYQNKLIERYVESESGLCFVDNPHIPNILKTSLGNVTLPFNLKVISLRYSNLSKPVLCFDESVKEDLDNMESLFSDANRVGDLSFYKTSMPNLFVLKDCALPNDASLKFTFAGIESDRGIKRKIKELIYPQWYQNYSFAVPIGYVNNVVYNGVEIGFIEMGDANNRRVLSIELAE